MTEILRDPFVILAAGAVVIALIIAVTLILKSYDENEEHKNRTGKDDD